MLHIIGFIVLTSFGQNDTFEHPEMNQTSFLPGEELEYKMKFSIFTVGKGKAVIQDQLYNFNNRSAYKIDVFGKTSGLVDWIAKVDDHWGSYLDTASLLPHQAFRNIKEGRYRRNEIVRFDHATNMIEVKVLNQKTGKFKDPEFYYAPGRQIFDMMGGMMYFRSLDFDKINVGDTLVVDTFLENTFYNFQTVFSGKEIIKTKLGKFRSLVLVPIMPDNSLFKGENAIKIWISDDKNKMPLRAEAEMFIGSAGLEIIGFKGLRNPVSSFVLGS
ncbi:MAG: DUF3108 domain-containing protein [Bacteroidetes bacterium]|nr:DUF3108 domain-containing protein [Bacteroidota bacterium]